MRTPPRQKVAAARSGAAGSQGRALKTTMCEMESSVRKLEEGGRVLHEFSEENNGIAIHLALMAARGNVDDHALATFAERVRSTAERFHKLSDSVSSIAQGLLGSCYAIKEKAGTEIEMPAAAIDAEVVRSDSRNRPADRRAELRSRKADHGSRKRAA